MWSLGRGECGAWGGITVEPGERHPTDLTDKYDNLFKPSHSLLQQILLLPGGPLITNTPRVSQCRDFVSPEGLCETPKVHWARMAEATQPRAPYMSDLRLISTVSAGSKARM